MAAVAEAALLPESAQLGEAAVQLTSGQRPQSYFAKTGSIDDVTLLSVRQREHHGAHGRMAALVHRLADRADAKIRAGKYAVQQRRLADARRTREHRPTPAQHRSHGFKPDACLHRGVVHGVPDALVRRERGTRSRFADEIDLVDD